MAKPLHEPTEKTRSEVVALTSFGVRQEEVATYLDIDPKTLRKYYRRELDTSLIKTNMQVAKSLFRNATENENVSAQIFWLKTKAGWKEDKEEEKPQDTSITINLVDAVKPEDAD